MIKSVYDKIVETHHITNIEFIGKEQTLGRANSNPLIGTCSCQQDEIISCIGISKLTTTNINTQLSMTFNANDESLVEYLYSDEYINPNGSSVIIKKYFLKLKAGTILTYRLNGFSNGFNYYDFYSICSV